MIIANNKKAFFDYFIEEKYEAGIELKGSEVKSIKAGKVNIKESFITKKQQLFYIEKHKTKKIRSTQNRTADRKEQYCRPSTNRQ